MGAQGRLRASSTNGCLEKEMAYKEELLQERAWFQTGRSEIKNQLEGQEAFFRMKKVTSTNKLIKQGN